jgi:hypothetical protein
VTRPVLISGFPGAGKSHFGRWAEASHGLLFVDADHGGVSQLGIGAEWEAFVQSFDARPMLDKLAARNAVYAWVWGFPVRSLPWLRALLAPGRMTPWWFTGAREALKRSYAQREGTRPADFERQHGELERAWPEIAPLFGDRVVHTMDETGARLDCAAIYSRVLGG